MKVSWEYYSQWKTLKKSSKPPARYLSGTPPHPFLPRRHVVGHVAQICPGTLHGHHEAIGLTGLVKQVVQGAFQHDGPGPWQNIVT